MDDINGMIAKSVQKGLKRRIKASIWVEVVDNDAIKVSITAFNHTWEYSEPGIYNTIINGNVTKLVNKIFRLYRGYILNSYFVKSNKVGKVNKIVDKKKEEKECNA